MNLNVCRYAGFGEESEHVTSFPVEDLRPDLHAVDPDVHYKVHSKAFIDQIPCPQVQLYILTTVILGSESFTRWLVMGAQSFCVPTV